MASRVSKMESSHSTVVENILIKAKEHLDEKMKESALEYNRRIKTLETDLKDLIGEHKFTKKQIEQIEKVMAAEKKTNAAKAAVAGGGQTGGNYDHREKKRINDAINTVHTSIDDIRKDQK
jgi:hypothetical protein